MTGTLREQLDELLNAVEPAPLPLERIRRRALGIRLRRTGAAAGGLAAAGLVAALLAGSSAPLSAPAPATGGPIQPGTPFASGVVAGQAWRLAVQDIAGPGYRCVPGVTIDGSDADPIAPVRLPGLASSAGNPAFITLGSALPGTGVGFVQVAPGIDALSVVVNGASKVLRTTAVTACGERFGLVGFDYPLTARLRLDAGSASVTVPGVLSDPPNGGVFPQAAGVWQNQAASYGDLASGTLATGWAYGGVWKIQVEFGAAGDCYQFIAGSSSMGACGPVSTPDGLATIMALPFGSGDDGAVIYASEVSPDTAGVVAWLSDGSTTSAVPQVVDGRKYAALFVVGPTRIIRLTWLNRFGGTIASTTSVARYGVTQFQP